MQYNIINIKDIKLIFRNNVIYFIKYNYLKYSLYMKL